jgi:hypothetical protein
MKERQTVSVSQETYEKLKEVQKQMAEKFGFAPTVTQVIDMMINFYNKCEGEEK